jgi:AcrR family transcriptional regulator
MDKRIQRTRELLEKALIELIGERDYDSITVQDIVERANLGRTTFYLHYSSKDELFMSCHELVISDFNVGSFYPHPLSREELLSSKTPEGMIEAYRHLKEAEAHLYPVFQGKDAPQLLRRIRDRSAEEIEANLRSAFSEEASLIPFELLANYLAGAQLALVQWWLEKHRSYSAEALAQSFHRLQRSAIRDALALEDSEERG